MAQFTLPRNSKVTNGTHHPAKDGAQNTRTFTIYRWSPEDDENPRLDSFEIDLMSIKFIIGLVGVSTQIILVLSVINSET